MSKKTAFTDYNAPSSEHFRLHAENPLCTIHTTRPNTIPLTILRVHYYSSNEPMIKYAVKFE
jgi:hypothetical protein